MQINNLNIDFKLRKKLGLSYTQYNMLVLILSFHSNNKRLYCKDGYLANQLGVTRRWIIKTRQVLISKKYIFVDHTSGYQVTPELETLLQDLNRYKPVKQDFERSQTAFESKKTLKYGKKVKKTSDFTEEYIHELKNDIKIQVNMSDDEIQQGIETGFKLFAETVVFNE